jgi:hypothetical protein
MVVLYFRIATLTPTDPSDPVRLDVVTHDTIKIALLVFALYAIWDLLGIVMTFGTRYWKIDEKNLDDRNGRPSADIRGWLVTLLCLVLSAVLYLVWVDGSHITHRSAQWMLVAIGAILILYRWLKELRTTAKLPT